MLAPAFRDGRAGRKMKARMTVSFAREGENTGRKYCACRHGAGIFPLAEDVYQALRVKSFKEAKFAL